MSLSAARLAQGQKGEMAAMVYMQSDPGCHRFIDVRKDVKYYMDDIDFILERKDGKRIKLEAKTDTLGDRYGNFCFPIKTIYTNNPRMKELLGWPFRSKADIITIYDEVNQILYVFELEKFRKFYKKYTANYQIRSIHRIDKDNPDISREIALIPKRFVEQITKAKMSILEFDENKKYSKMVPNL